jgi:hypothetical protein
MNQSAPTRPSPTLSTHLSRLRNSSLSDLVTLFGDQVSSEELLMEGLGESGRVRLFSPPVTFWTFLSQVLAPGGPCTEALAKARVHFRTQLDVETSSSTSAYCQARARLPLGLLGKIGPQIAETLENAAEEHDLWLGRRVRVVDATGTSMPDTPANQARYPQDSAQKPGCGFPAMRLLAVFSLATGAILAAVKGSLHDHEEKLFRRVWAHLRAGEVVLGDRMFGSYATIALLQECLVDSVFRLNARRKIDFRKGKRLRKKDRIFTWTKPRQPLRGLPLFLYNRLPDFMEVRILEVSVEEFGFRSKTIRVVTTLLDPRRYPKEAIADLYRRRWRAELFFRDIKCSMHMDVLRGKSPKIVHRELAMYLIAYNLIRCLMFRAAKKHRVPVTRISFTGTLYTLRAWAIELAKASGRPRQLRRMLGCVIDQIASNIVPDRPNRLEPRARKRRPKAYQLLNRPRQEFHEILHRNRYKKSLS